MWVEALDLILRRLQEASFPFERVVAVSGSGQQHGSVYWASGAHSKLQSLRPSDSLAAQLKDAFVTPGETRLTKHFDSRKSMVPGYLI